MKKYKKIFYKYKSPKQTFFLILILFFLFNFLYITSSFSKYKTCRQLFLKERTNLKLEDTSSKAIILLRKKSLEAIEYSIISTIIEYIFLATNLSKLWDIRDYFHSLSEKESHLLQLKIKDTINEIFTKLTFRKSTDQNQINQVTKGLYSPKIFIHALIHACSCLF